MRRAAWACICLAILIGGVSSGAWAIERELAGVRLGAMALDLLNKPGYGEPDFIGPLGTVAIASALEGQAPATATARRTGAAGTSTRGPVGPSGGGARGGGGMRGGMGPGGGGRGGMGRGGGLGAGARGGRMGGGGAGVAAGARAPQRGAGGGMYWYYKRPGGSVVVLSLDPRGEVTAITLAGTAPYLGGRTSRGIGLTNSYMEIIAQYGYPDQMVTGGSQMELTYVDHGVRFTLENMQVREIAIGTHIGQAIETAPAAPAEIAPPPAGMSVEELRGYL